MDKSLKLHNLISVYRAMTNIKPIDRSDYFNQYYGEVIERLREEYKGFL